jgi:hypothetical protein
MTLNQIRILMDAQPFEPFVMFLADGRSVAVPHPEFLGFYERSRIVIVHEVGGSCEIVDPQLVTSLRIPAPPIPTS